MSGFNKPDHNEWEELNRPRREHIRRLMDKSVKGKANLEEETELWKALIDDEQLFREYEINLGIAKLCREAKLSMN